MAKGIIKTKYLGKQVSEGTLERVEWPADQEITVKLNCTEFTSRCPVTGQPDFAALMIEYVPDQFIAETKSVKLWLQSYREKRAFNEQIISDLAHEFYAAIEPKSVTVKGVFHHRGGISVEPICMLEYARATPVKINERPIFS